MTLQPDPFATPSSDSSSASFPPPPAGFPPAPGFPGAGNVYIEPPNGLALWAKILTGLVTLLSVALAATATTYPDYLRSATGSETTFSLHEIFSFLIILPLLASFILLALWMQSIRKNMDVLRNSAHQLHRSFAWWGWFIPLASIVLPLIYMRDLARKAHGGFLAMWWAGFLLSSLLDNVSGQVVGFDGTVNVALLDSYAVLTIISGAAMVISYVGLFMLISKITAEHATPALTMPPAPPVAPPLPAPPAGPTVV